MIQERPLDTSLSRLLEGVATAIDMPNEMYEKAVEEYNDVGDWLCGKDSPLAKFGAIFYSQGSIRLGIANRPLIRGEEYDIDGVCRLLIRKESITQQHLKDLIGDRLKENPKYFKILVEGRRCWTLDYRGNFHLDILPAIPNVEGAEDSILITDRDLRNWQFSNPIGYSNWFRAQMAEIFQTRLKALAAQLNLSVEDVPKWRVKTPLQRSVQLIKRHRDVYFQSDREGKPVSIIITTLAAQAYRGESDLLSAASWIVAHMRDGIGMKNGHYDIPNPVQPEENFADKWREHPERQKKFFAWLDKLERDFEKLQSEEGLPAIGNLFKEMFGKAATEEVFNTFGEDLRKQRTQGRLKAATGTGALGATGTTIKPHNFYGENKKEET